MDVELFNQLFYFICMCMETLYCIKNIEHINLFKDFIFLRKISFSKTDEYNGKAIL